MKKILIVFFGVCASLAVHSQSISASAYNCAGGSKVIGGNTYEWSFAEMLLVNTAVNPNIIVTSGVLQPVDLTVGTEEYPAVSGKVNVYPCPTADLLNIETAFDNSGKLNYQLMDITGKMLIVNQAALSSGSNVNTISLSRYPAGEYLLRILYSPESGASKYTETFKVQKLQ